MAQMQQLEIFKRGLAPFNKKDPQILPLFLWDTKTHPLKDKYREEHTIEQREEISVQWVKWMENKNCWISLYEWYYSYQLDGLPIELKPAEFPEKIVSMVSKPNKRTRSELAQQLGYPTPAKSQAILVQMMDTEEPEPKKIHKWYTVTGQVIETENDIPPWDDLVITKDNQKYNMMPLQSDADTLTDRNSVASTNWTNVCLHKSHKVLDKKISIIGKEQRELTKKYLVNIDTNTILLSQKMDRQFGLSVKEFEDTGKKLEREIIDRRLNLHDVSDNVDAIGNALAELKLEHTRTADKIDYFERSKRLSSQQKKEQAEKIKAEKEKMVRPTSLSLYKPESRLKFDPVNIESTTDIPIVDVPTRFEFGKKTEQLLSDPFSSIRFSLPNKATTTSEYHPSPIETIYYEPQFIMSLRMMELLI